jgi:hypothetical protein
MHERCESEDGQIGRRREYFPSLVATKAVVAIAADSAYGLVGSVLRSRTLVRR